MSVSFNVQYASSVEITHIVKSCSSGLSPVLHEMRIAVTSNNADVAVYVSTLDVLEAILQNCPQDQLDKMLELARREIRARGECIDG